MNKFILVLALIGFATALRADSYSNLWSAWKTQYKKTYATAAEDLVRFSLFVENYHEINKLNAENGSARFALNKFADLTRSEFKAKYASGAFHQKDRNIVAANTISSSIEGLPDSVDWRTKGAVTPVKNQGQCGSCWVFSTNGVLEGFYFINNGQLLSFSEQQGVDCDRDDGNQGCNGGWPHLYLQYAAKNGLELESDYPYTAADGDCQYNKTKTKTVAGGYKFVTPNSTAHLKAALVSSPVSVLIEADENAFRYYTSGVVTKDCGAVLDFSVLVVGYEKVGSTEAFIIKNAWGTDWGDKGYIRIATTQSPNGGQGVCGILSQPLIATK